MDLVAEGHMQEGTSGRWIKLDRFTLFLLFTLVDSKNFLYCILQLGHFFIHFGRIMKWCTQGIFRSWKVFSLLHIWRLFSFSFIVPFCFEQTPVGIMITSSLLSILQEMELARSFRKNKFKIKLCEVRCCCFWYIHVNCAYLVTHALLLWLISYGDKMFCRMHKNTPSLYSLFFFSSLHLHIVECRADLTMGTDKGQDVQGARSAGRCWFSVVEC
jgi:hypothetical protein